MTLMKEKAVEMIQRMPEENMLYVIHILQNMEAMSGNREEEKKKAKKAFIDIMNLEKRLPEDFDSEKELEKARKERYEN